MRIIKSELKINPFDKEETLMKTGNILLMLTAFGIAATNCMLLLSSGVFIELSLAYSSPSALAIFHSTFAKILLKDAWIVFPIVLMIGMIAKEFKINSVRKCVYINMGLLAVVVIHCGALSYMLFRPMFCNRCAPSSITDSCNPKRVSPLGVGTFDGDLSDITNPSN